MTNHSGGGTPRTHKHSFEVAHKHDIIRCVRIEFAEQLERELAAAQSALAEKERELLAARKLLLWANEFIIEPEWFPNEGDRQFWRERRSALSAGEEKT